MYQHPYSTRAGRILLAVIFLVSGLTKIANPEGTQSYMVAMGLTWATTFLYFGAIGIEIGAGLSVSLGYWTRGGAMALILFMIPTTLIFHSHWSDQNQMIHFLKNLAMIGGLVYLVIHGPGPVSLDHGLGKLHQMKSPNTTTSVQSPPKAA